MGGVRLGGVDLLLLLWFTRVRGNFDSISVVAWWCSVKLVVESDLRCVMSSAVTSWRMVGVVLWYAGERSGSVLRKRLVVL